MSRMVKKSPPRATFEEFTLAGGLRVFHHRKKRTSKIFTAQLKFFVGSRDEPPSLSGISHFLEHAVFLGTKSFASREAVELALLELGGQCNASTGKDFTSFELSGRLGKMSLGIELLFDLAFRPLLNGDIAAERKVILAELGEYSDARGRSTDSYEIAMEKLLPEFGEKSPVLGSKSSIQEINETDLKRYHQKKYLRKNAVLVMSSSYPVARVKELLQGVRPFSYKPDTKVGRPAKNRSKNDVTKKAAVIKATKIPTPQIAFIETNAGSYSLDLYFLNGGVLKAKELAVLTLLNYALFDGEGSALFGAARKAGLAYSLQGEVVASDFYNMFTIDAEIPVGAFSKFMKFFKKAVKTILEKPLDEKMIALFKGRVVFDVDLNRETPEGLVDEFTSCLRMGKVAVTDMNVLKEIEALTGSDIRQALFDVLQADRICVVLSGRNAKNREREIEQLISTLFLEAKSHPQKKYSKK